MAHALDIKNLPTPKIEEWKYTNLPRALPEGLDEIPPQRDEKVFHLSCGQKSEELVEILWQGEQGQHLQPVLKITLEEGAELHLLERQAGEGAYWKNMVVEIDLAPRSRLVHYRLQEESSEAVHTTMSHIRLGTESHYECISLNTGGRLSRHEVVAELQGEDIMCSFDGVNLFRGEQHGDTTIRMIHHAPDCTSNQNYRSLLDDQARGVFQGKVYVHREAQKTDGYQLSNAILLSEAAEMDTKPELEIYADDVKCSHGATTGALEETPLFYMRSRGIPEAEARELLLTSFVGEIVDKIENETINRGMREKISRWLKDA